jgi:hypothetical protein
LLGRRRPLNELLNTIHQLFGPYLEQILLAIAPQPPLTGVSQPAEVSSMDSVNAVVRYFKLCNIIYSIAQEGLSKVGACHSSRQIDWYPSRIVLSLHRHRANLLF